MDREAYSALSPPIQGRPNDLLLAKVVVRCRPELGIGEIDSFSADGREVSVAFYGAPGACVVHRASAKDVCPVVLDRESRAFTRTETGALYGRVIACAEESTTPRKYYLRFQGKDELTVLDETAFCVKASGVPADPVAGLKALALESPFLYELRAPFLRDILKLRESTHGYDGISSSKVNFHAHQVQIARHILSDVRIRHLLADEVGLGKTIETGLILRQVLLDTPRLRPVVYAPARLVAQWRRELCDRFELHAVSVRSHRELSYPEALTDVDLLVIDEAHHLLEGMDADWHGNAMYENVRRASGSVPHILLLSATPVLHRERELLALLNLLEPRSFPLDGLDRFREIIARRQDVGRCLLALITATRSFLQRRHLAQLRALLPDDPVIQELVEQSSDREGADLSVLAQRGAAHVSETYRLYRRMMRTRRSWLVSELGFPGRTVLRESDEYSLSEDDMSELWGALEELRIELHSLCEADLLPRLGAMGIYFDLVSAICTGLPRVRQIAARPGKILSPKAEGLLAGMAGLADTLCQDGLDRPHLLREVLISRGNRDSARRYIVFCSGESLPAVEAVLRSDPCLDGVYQVASDRDVISVPTDPSGLDEDLLFVIADESMEEGANLQAFDGIIFYDLPWHPMRMEQRIGRLDRIVRTSPVRCACLLSAEDEQAVDGAWLRILEDGFGLFARSLSDIQFLVEREMPRLRDVLFEGGPAALAQEVQPLREIIEEERNRLDEQDVIDGIRHKAEDAMAFKKALEEGDRMVDSLRNSFIRFVTDGLRLRWNPTTGLEIDRDGRSPLVPLGMVKDIVRGSRGRNTFSREDAVARPGDAGLLRPGHPMVGVCESFLGSDDRGRVFAMYRTRPYVQSDTVVFRVVAAGKMDLGAVADRLSASSWDEQSQAALLRMVRGWMPDFLEQVFMLESGTEAEDALVRICCELYDKRGGDVSLGKDRVAFLMNRFGSDGWTRIVDRVHEQALARVAAKDEVRARLAAAEDASSRFFAMREAVLSAMATAGDPQAATAKAELGELQVLVHEVLGRLSLSIDSIGAYYLSPIPFGENGETQV